MRVLGNSPDLVKAWNSLDGSRGPSLAQVVGQEAIMTIRLSLAMLLLGACSGASPLPGMDPGTDPSQAPAPPTGGIVPSAVDSLGVSTGGTVGGTAAALPDLTLCQAIDPVNLAANFVTTVGTDWVRFACKQTCADVASCEFDATGANGAINSKRGYQRMKALLFVVDDMGGHLLYTPDGDDVVLTHGGAGATDFVHPFDGNLQAHSSLKTVAVSWEHGISTFFSTGSGWHTRKDATPSSLRRHAVRPAAVINFVKQQFAAGKKLGTVGSSLGSVATLGARLWYGLDPILDYQMYIGGPANWDVNAGCGRMHYATGHCDVDASPCAGNPASSYGDDDTLCASGGTDQCRVPTIMAFGTWAKLINYLDVSSACTTDVTTVDSPIASLDESSAKSVASSFTFHGPTDIIMNEGAAQQAGNPADQGMGEGQAAYLYAAIQSDKSWVDNQGFGHGDSWDKVPSLMADAAMRVLVGMSK
jgi:hypothetical protein